MTRSVLAMIAIALFAPTSDACPGKRAGGLFHRIMHRGGSGCQAVAASSYSSTTTTTTRTVRASGVQVMPAPVQQFKLVPVTQCPCQAGSPVAGCPCVVPVKKKG